MRQVLSLALVAVSVLAVLPRAIGIASTRTEPREARDASSRQRSDTIVKLAGAPRHPGIATLVEELSIGRDSGPNEYLFSAIADILPFADGSVLVQDAVASGSPGGGRGLGGSFIRLYDARGQFVRAFGRPGQGPGEYVQARGIARHPDGRVLVNDASQMRVNVYAASGESISQWPFAFTGFVGSPGQPALQTILTDTAGYIYRAVPMRAHDPGDVGPRPPAGYARSRADGTVVDTIAPPDFPGAPTYDLELMQARIGSSTFTYPIPYWPNATWAWSPLGYMIASVPTRYAIDLRIPVRRNGTSSAPARWMPGDPVVSIRRNIPPVSISEAERAEHRAGIEGAMRGRLTGWRWTAPDIPRTKPAYTSLRVALDGRIWVAVSQPSVPRTVAPGQEALVARGCYDCAMHFAWAPPIYDVFEPDGTYLGQVRLPGGRPTALRGDYVWGVVADSNDVPRVKKWRIAWR